MVEYDDAAETLGLRPMAWQRIAARYANARTGARWTYREVAWVVARQNGKTTGLLPLVLQRLRVGRKILHTAQNRSLPRETFLTLAQALNGHPDVTEVRYANGQEVIKFANGGRYTLVAPTKSGARGYGVDDVILDEVREQRSFDIVASIKPALTASPDPQLLYISNAGDEESIVLNDLRRRADTDPSLAYLEWSAAPDRVLGDRLGWAEANPALGTTIQLDTLEDFHRSLPVAVFETEHLCRWVETMMPSILDPETWEGLRAVLEEPRRPMLGVSMDPSGKRASAVLAWQEPTGRIGSRVIADVFGDPIDISRLGADLREVALRAGVARVGFDPVTDAELAKYFKHTDPVTGAKFANASALFVTTATGGRLAWDRGDEIGLDLKWAGRKAHETPGAWTAVKAKDDRPITALLAAIRAVWLASGPAPSVPRIY